MPKLSCEIQELDLSIQRSLIARIRTAANVYKSTCAGVSTDPLKSYLSALESLAEYVATRRRGSALYDEVRAAGHQELAVQPLPKVKKHGPMLIPFTPPAGAPGFAVAGGVSCESLAG
jgi:hypothetical protein